MNLFQGALFRVRARKTDHAMQRIQEGETGPLYF